MRKPLFFDQIQIGDIVESIPRTITETDIWLFAYLTADFFPLHTDIEFAKKTIFGERIAQGMLILSIAWAWWIKSFYLTTMLVRLWLFMASGRLDFELR